MTRVVADLLRRNERLRPDHPAIWYEDRCLTHAQYAQRVRRLANGLIALGLRKQDRIAIMAQNSSAYVELYGAAEWAGFIAATVNFRLAAAEVLGILTDCTPRVLAFDIEYAPLVAELRAQLSWPITFVCIGGHPDWAEEYDAVVATASDDEPGFASQPDDIAYIIYTSGTTGRPKGVMHSHAGVIAQTRTISAADAIVPSDRLLIAMPLFHSGAKNNHLANVWCGATTYIHRKFDPVIELETIARERITVLHLAPVMVQMMLDVPQFASYDCSSLRTIHYASAPMSAALLRRALAAFGPIFIQLYGMTENGCATVLHKDQHRLDGAKWLRRLASAGQPHVGAEIRIVGDDGRECPPETPGEIAIRSDAALRGYWNNSDATVQALRDGWVYSGDVGLLDDEGFLYVVDRKKDMIVSGGENIYSREVEEALLAHEAVADAVVIGVPDAVWGESVKALVVRRHGTEATEAMLVEHCRTLIASYKKPRSIEFVDHYPRLANGKVDKKTLREPYWQGHTRRIS